MVCLGNICRSPIAEGILQSKIDELGINWEVDSAGTSGFHNGERPDRRSIEESSLNGIDISNQVSRQFTRDDLQRFDLILAMDKSNMSNILSMCSTDQERSKVKLIMDYTYPGQGVEVPDPYYLDGFDLVFEMLDAAIDHMIELETETVFK
jgi:protein-tyrosine phosphatase